MEIEHQATKENTKGENKDGLIAEQTKDELKEVEHNEMMNKALNQENKFPKPLLAFKWQKNSVKMKTNLQGSIAKAFSIFDQDDDTKKRSMFLKNELHNDDTNSINDKYVQVICSYKEPVWSEIPTGVYKMDILKSGVILKTLDLSYKSYHVIGTSLSCDITLSHDTISEFHAVLQYRNIGDSENETGVYIYDLNSTHGTFLNGVKIKSDTYMIVHGGNLVSFGHSQRKYILRTPKDSKEQEAQLSATELKELQEIESQDQQKLNMEQSLKENELLTMKLEESKGISWGIIDIDELSRSTITSEYSDSDNEELYLDNPKKALQDWFKWEGYDLEYQTEDEGFGRFSCWIDLTLDALGSTKTIHVTVDGDKMKAIDECILKACQFLNNYGFLQRACKEKKSTIRNWEAADYYDSDEDNYLDRTGSIERKRQKRMEMNGKFKTQEMHNSLSEKYTEVCNKITNLESLLNLPKHEEDKNENSDEDALDLFMTKLNPLSLSKSKIKDVKLEIQNLYKERMLLLNSININTTTLGNGQSESHAGNITEKTKNGCRINN